MTGKHSKNHEKSRRKILREEYEQQQPHYTEGIWEEAMLENNSYWDVDYLEKVNAKTNQGIKYWKERYANASGNMGKWYCQVRINILKKKLKHYENKS
jgi:hypothetical protein